jgi:hypothetical protein
MQPLRRFLKRQALRKKELSEKNTSSDENGETVAYSLSSEKNGENRKY